MAIDTARKRMSVLAISCMANGPAVFVDGSITVGDRRTIGYSYAGELTAVDGVEFIVVGTSYVSVPSATGSISVPSATGSIIV